MKDLRKASEVEQMKIIGSFERYTNHVISEVKDCYFLDSKFQPIFTLLKDSHFKGTDLNSALIENNLSTLYMTCKMGSIFLKTELEQSISNLKNYYSRIKTKETITSYNGKEVINTSEFIGEVMGELTNILTDSGGEKTEIGGLIDDFELMQEVYKTNTKKYLGYETGFKSLDELTDGIRPEHLWAIGGYTSAGKTYFTLNIINNLINQGVKVSFYSLEMSKNDLIGRLLGLQIGHSPNLIMRDIGTNKEDLQKAKDRLKKSGLTIHSEKTELSQMLMSMYSETVSKKADVFIIDYAQNVQVKSENEYNALRIMAVELQAFCRKNKIPVLLLSQVSNEHARSPESGLIGFKGSGAIGASADIALELISAHDKDTRDSLIALNQPLEVKACIKKNRHGRIGTILFNFHNGIFTQK
jgi:replicative DNA helicase